MVPFGATRDEAAKIQLKRRETLDKVKSLQQVYSERGEKAFMDVLAEPSALACFGESRPFVEAKTAIQAAPAKELWKC